MFYRLFVEMAANARAQRGQRAESQALAYLESQGLLCVARNWRCPLGELDIVMRDGDVVVFVEVRARATRRFGGAAESITPTKQRRLERAAAWYLQALDGIPPCRFDAVLLEGHEAPVWLKNIFG